MILPELIAIGFAALSWKWYLTGAALWVRYLIGRFWDRRRTKSMRDPGHADLQLISPRVWRVGIDLIFSAFLVSGVADFLRFVSAPANCD